MLVDETVILADLVAQNATNQEIADALGISYNAARKRKGRYLKNADHVRFQETANSTVEEDIAKLAEKKVSISLQQKYNTALRRINELTTLNDSLLTIKQAKTQITKVVANPELQNEVTAVIVASDWHIEEPVDASTVNYMNEFNLEIAEQRVHRFMQNAAKLVNMFAKSSNLRHAVLALLGDFITGSIHEELAETNQLAPVEAAIAVKNYLLSTIEYILENTDLDSLTVVCKVGNHGRITKKCYNATELGNSLEYFVYDAIYHYYLNSDVVNVIVEDSYHTYLDVYDYTIRFHHGHRLSYNGGVGGLHIPVNKAIASWNRGIKADLDVFGHWHQWVPTDTFICNPSLIGYNAYAIGIKAPFEPARQSFFLVDKRHGKTVVCPIFLED